LLLYQPAPGADPEVPKELQPKTITLQQKEITVAKALEELARQTGNSVEDRRRIREDTKLKLDLKKATFWQALDAIAKEADARIYLYARGGAITLVDGPHQVTPVSYNGLFRVAVKQIDTTLMLEPEAHFCTIKLEVAWEPRFQPLFMETKPASLAARDDKGHDLEIPQGGQGRAPVIRGLATEISLRLPAPRRSVLSLGLLKGQLTVVGPTRMLTFTFDNLKKIDDKESARKETQDGIGVTLRELTEDSCKVWAAGVLLEYPTEGPQFESFQSYLVNNESYLENKKDPKQRLQPIGQESERLTQTKSVMRYHFAGAQGADLKFDDWKLVYRTPGKIVELPIPFEFKDLPLP
jgi:hypothetical protein